MHSLQGLRKRLSAGGDIARISSWFGVQKKWYVDFDKCIPYFAETSGCAICIAVCPGPCRVSASLWQRRCGGALRGKDLSET